MAKYHISKSGKPALCKAISREEEEVARTKLANLAKRIKGKESEVALIRESLQGHKTAGGGSVLSMSQHNSTQRAIVPLTGFCANLYPELSATFNSSKEMKKVVAKHILIYKYLKV